MNFVHLHTHSHFSMLDGLASPADLARHAKKLGMTAIALTDHGNLYGAIEFYQACLKEEIKPILGVEVYVCEDMHDKTSTAANRHHLILLAQNMTGWKNLLQLVTKSNLEGFHYKPRIDKKVLREHSEGLIGLSGCLSGDIPQALRADNLDKARALLAEYQDIFTQGHFYIELSSHPGIPDHKDVQEKLLALAKETATPIVATQDAHYLHHDEAPFQDILLGVQTGTDLDDQDRLTMNLDDFSLRPSKEMIELFSEHPEAIENTEKIAGKITLELELDKVQLPHYELPDGETNETYLKKLTHEAIENVYPEDERETARTQLDFELDVIDRTGFSSYFLIVGDLVSWAKKQKIVVGPGRGSAAGSIIAYLLNITTVDPIKYHLLFERFMNPDRVSMPDIDLDFADSRRDEVIAYIGQKYGRDHVAQIITFGTMAARAAIRDSGRAIGLSYGFCDEIAKLIPFGPGWTLKKAYEAVPELKERWDDEPDAKRLLEAASHLEGVVRHASTHACGLVVSKDPLPETIPLQYSTTGSGESKALVTQFNGPAVESLGLLKMDILGLSNLTIIEETINRVRDHHGETIDIEKISLEDKLSYRQLTKGHTVGVFQLESQGMTRYLKELKPTDFEDLVTMIALYRPGSMEQIPSYILRKHGKEEVSYPHPLLEQYLKSTHGIMIYQEQLMQMSRVMADFTPGEADTLRKAVGKKIHALLARQKEKFVEGVVKKTGSERLAAQLWELILPFANYGFNRSHAVCYAKVAYQTAYLKAHYPVAFMASLLNSDSKNIERMSFLIASAKQEGIEVLPPDINQSGSDFEITKDDKIRFGLGAIKNVGHNVVTALVQEREKNGPFTSITNLLERADGSTLNKRSLESLIKTGALDDFGERMSLLENMETMLAYLRAAHSARTSQQDSLFGLMEESVLPELKLAPSDTASAREKLVWEKELLGLYVSGHPLDAFPAAKDIGPNIRDAKAGRKRKTVRVAGLLASVKRIMTKAGDPMAFLTLEDTDDQIEAVMFPRTLQQYGGILEANTCVAIEGKIQMRNGEHNLLCDKVEILEG